MALGKVTGRKRMKVLTDSCVNTDGQPRKVGNFYTQTFVGSNKKAVKIDFQNISHSGKKDFY